MYVRLIWNRYVVMALLVSGMLLAGCVDMPVIEDYDEPIAQRSKR